MRIQMAGKNAKFDTFGWCLFLLAAVLGIFTVWFTLNINLTQGAGFQLYQFYDRSIHFLLVMLSILIYLSVFLMGIYTYRYVPNTKLLSIGYTFFITGVLDTFFLTGITGFMLFPDPAVISLRSDIFLVVSRFVCALGILMVCNVSEYRKVPVKIFFWLFIDIFITASLIWLIGWNPWDILTAIWSDPAVAIRYVQGGIILLLFAAMLVTFINYRAYPDRLHIIMAASFTLLISSEIIFLAIGSAAPYSTDIALLLRFIGLALLFDVFYIHGVRRPYVLLSEAKDTLNQYANDLDKQVVERTAELTYMNDRLIADVELARDVQRSMLPASLPQGESVRFSVGYYPAETLSGDFYNVFRIDANRFGFCIGDVAGHGVSAAMLTVFAFQSVQSLQDEPRGAGVILPSFVLKHLYDGFNAANFQDEHYMVLIYGVYNMETGILSYASGGLNTTPVVIRPDGTLQMLESEGTAICKLGEFMKPQYQNRQLMMFPGDKLVLYTDGLTEARSATGEMYALERLSSVLRKGARMDPDALSERVIADVRAFTGMGTNDDDITLLIMEVVQSF